MDVILFNTQTHSNEEVCIGNKHTKLIFTLISTILYMSIYSPHTPAQRERATKQLRHVHRLFTSSTALQTE